MKLNDIPAGGEALSHRDSGASPRIAVIGGGIAGLGTAWLLGRRHAVTLFEAGHYAGGHANTVDITVDGVTHPVDTGFLVFNRRTYPNLCGLFRALDVPIAASDMSFGVSLQQEGIEWAGTDLTTLFAQHSNLVRPAFWGMLRDLRRFNAETTRLAREHAAPDVSLGEYLDANGYGEAFRYWYLLPMGAAIWSCPTEQMLAYPLATFLRFCHNHGLLQVLDRPQWMTVRGGSREYVKRMLPGIPDLRLNSPVAGVRRDAAGVSVLTAAGAEHFDAVVFACHSDTALRILGDQASAGERSVLGAVRYQPNRALLHTDPALLPARQKVWSAWNYLTGAGQADQRPVSVSYLLNQLQPLPFKSPVVVSLNPFREPAPEHLIAAFEYDHPVFDQRAIDAQAHLPMLQGQQHTWFAGAWTGYGFHEDGIKSAVDVAAMLGVVAPWKARQFDFAGATA
ncbi:NAD(P)/FAD-dependent oxidoreductase [Uliginosibacterium aquaticum]|uniref:FAD-dependent oxidoreductase n=1 Tax=Uliginosibacterium aquaticum TaxID=2731212 RepID=A0ABX2II99_9RHOO|nr:FAD-dependent oxidoreductase [Uliginosibacterium aquaticum]NSL56496.1 FAD-dependent oxidoreductase [Uliginosibacterium aquaticum]